MIPFREINAKAVDYVKPLVERWVGPATKATQGWKACCPFHSEKTPSFMVYSDDGHWHCWGCGAHGLDLIDLYAKTQNVSPADAARAVAKVVGHPFADTVAAPRHA